jgi:hypothetical protein
MNERIHLKTVLSEAGGNSGKPLALFALLSLGLLESLASGSIGAADAVSIFFHADNCLFVHQRLRDRMAEQVMSHGVQLPDLFEALPPKEAQQEFQRELATMRSLCLALLGEKRLAA